jgi:site-specific recombinase XerD
LYDAVREHLAHMRRRGLRPSTIRHRRYVLRRLEHFVAPLSVTETTLDDLRAYVDARAEILGDYSRATEISHLSAFFRWATAEGLVTVNPMVRLERPATVRGYPRPIPDEDLARALDCSAGQRVRPWLYLAAYAGLRAIDICALEAENVWLHAEPAIMFLRTKGGRMRSVPISVLLRDALVHEQLPRSGWLFPRLDGRAGHVPNGTVTALCNEYLHELGISHTLHTLRHWFGTKVYRETHDLRLVQELLGHRGPALVQLYAAVDPLDAVAAVNRIPRL